MNKIAVAGILGGALLGGFLLYKHSQTAGPAQSNKDYLINIWLAGAADAAVNHPNHLAMVNSLSDADLQLVYTIVHDYFNANLPLPANLSAVWERVATPFGLG